MIPRLPSRSTPFVGRRNELAEIADLLSDPDCRLVTLTGPGGIGKTSLALETARSLLNVYTDGVFFVGLASARTEDPICSTIADALQITFHGERDPKVQIIDYLDAKNILLVMDNFEDLIGRAEYLSGFLQHTQNTKFLVTSRERLNLWEERIYEVRGLTIPEKEYSKTDDTRGLLENYSAIQLFLHKAQAVHQAFSLEEERQFVIRICELVEGQPLGIELAASWVRMLSCEEIVQEIEENLDFLATTARNIPERHRSLRAVFDHSWRLLSDDERKVLPRLSVFRGGFRREAAKDVTGASLPMLAALTDKSLLHQKKAGRYELHEVLRQYVEEILNGDPSQAARLKEAHAVFFAAFLEQREKSLIQARDRDAFEQVRDEMENLRVAWDWSVAQGNEQAIHAFSRGFYSLFSIRGWYKDGVDTLGKAIPVLRETLRVETDPGNEKYCTLGTVLGFRGALYRYLGRFEEARELLEESLSILRRYGAPRERRAPLLYLALIANAQGKDEEAKKLLDEGLAISREVGDQYKTSAHQAILGDIAYRKGAFDKARIHYQEALSESRAIGAQTGIARSFTRLGVLSETEGDYNGARQFLQKSLAISSELNDSREMAKCLVPLGRVAAAQGEMGDAKHLFLDALFIATEIEAMTVTLAALVEMADLFRIEGEREFAIELLALVLAHPSSDEDTRERGEKILARSASDLSPEVVRAARETGMIANLEETVAALLGGREETTDVIQERVETITSFMEDLRDPLGLAHTALGMIEMSPDYDPESDTGRFVTIAVGGLQRMNNLVESLEDIERLGGGRSALTLGRVNLIPLLEEVVERQRQIAATMGVELVLRVPPSGTETHISVDRKRLERVVTLLIDNALNATPPGGQVALNLGQGDGVLEISVNDTGEGIQKAQRGMSFDRAEQAEAVSQPSSVDLNLDYSRAVAEAHGGALRFEDGEDGVGTKIVITLPL